MAFGRHLERDNRLNEASRLYREALERYPNDQRLQQRLQIVTSNLAERRFIARRKTSPGSEPTVSAEAVFKVNAVRCRTLSGAKAVAACTAALSVKPDDRALKNRLADLVPPRPSQPPPEAQRTGQHAADRADSADVSESAFQRRRVWTISIQQSLARLGIDPGPIDGLSGERTRAAIKRFSKLPGVDLPTLKLGEALAQALDRAVAQERRAFEALRVLERRVDAGRLDGATDKLAQLELAVPWSRSVVRRCHIVEQKLAKLQVAPRQEPTQAMAEHRRRERERLAAAEEAVVTKARQAMRQGDLQEAMRLVEGGLEWQPENRELLNLRQSIAEPQRRRAASAKTTARPPRGFELLAKKVREKTQEQDFDAAQALLRQARDLAEDPNALARLKEDVLGAQLLAEAQAEYTRAQSLGNAGTATQAQLSALKAAYEKIEASLQKLPSNRTAIELRDQIVARQTETLAAQQQEEERRRRLADAETLLRRRSAQLAELEAELAARELDYKLEAQRVLEQMWP